MSVFSEPVFWTAVLGIAGILAAFFAPPLTQRKMERRRETRDFRRATRVVADELRRAAAALRFIEQTQEAVPGGILAFLELTAWESERAVLATSLDDEVWRTVNSAVQAMATARPALAASSLAASSLGTPFEADWLTTIRKQADETERAAQLLLEAQPLTD